MDREVPLRQMGPHPCTNDPPHIVLERATVMGYGEPRPWASSIEGRHGKSGIICSEEDQGTWSRHPGVEHHYLELGH